MTSDAGWSNGDPASLISSLGDDMREIVRKPGFFANESDEEPRVLCSELFYCGVSTVTARLRRYEVEGIYTFSVGIYGDLQPLIYVNPFHKNLARKIRL